MSKPYPNTRRRARQHLISEWLYRRFKRKGIGEPGDPISWDPIPKEFLFCHVQPNGIILLHDVRTLYTYLASQDRGPSTAAPVNPLTRVPFDLADLWRIERMAVKAGCLEEGKHLGFVKRHFANQALRHKTVALRRFVKTVRKNVRDLIQWTNSSDGKGCDNPDVLEVSDEEENGITHVKGILEAFLESLYAAETSIAKDVVRCIARELEGWPPKDLEWLHLKAMDLCRTYTHRNVLSSMCMDGRVSPTEFRRLLSGIQG